MNIFVKAFQNANNRGGGVYGLKKLSTSKQAAGTMGMLEDFGDMIIISHDRINAKVVRTSPQHLKLRKRNNNRFVSTKQNQYSLCRKKKISLFFRKNKVFSNVTKIPNGSQIFATYVQ